MSDPDPFPFDAPAFLKGDCGDPDACFGMRAIPGKGLAVRAFLPRAGRVELLDGETGQAAAVMRMVHPEGVFEARLPERDRPFPYRFRVHGWGEPLDLDDPYRFGPILGELDAYLMAEGTHLRLYEKLGAHPAAQDGVAGVAFAVWAPDARRVSVVGQFNNWDGRRHLMRRFRATGVWELFIPGLAPGDLYKFELKSRDGRLLPLKADPFAFRCEPAPGTASVVAPAPGHAWGDQRWMAGRRERNRYDAPVSIYEVHLGSWRRREDGGFLGYRELADQLIPYARRWASPTSSCCPSCEHPFYGSWGYQTTWATSPPPAATARPTTSGPSWTAAPGRASA